MIETLMKQFYFRDLGRRVEHVVAQRRESTPSEVYLYWIDGGDANDPWIAIGPNGEEWYRSDPGAIPGIDNSARRAASSPTSPTPKIANRESGSPASARSRRNLQERGQRFPCKHAKPLGARPNVSPRATPLRIVKTSAGPEVSRPGLPATPRIMFTAAEETEPAGRHEAQAGLDLRHQ